MKIIENEFNGMTIRKAVLEARLVNGLVKDAHPKYLQNEKETPYHWIEVELLNQDNGPTQRGSVIVWDKNLQENPSRYAEGKTITIEIALEGNGAGVAQEHMTNGRFDIASLGLSLNAIKEQVIDQEMVV
jgi:hypothetical protein